MCPAAKLLRQDLASGLIEPENYSPGVIYSQRSEYKEYDAAAFTRNLQNLCKEFVSLQETGSPPLQQWVKDGKFKQQGKFF